MQEKFSIFVIPDHHREAPAPAIPPEADHQLGPVLGGGIAGLPQQLRPGQTVQGDDLALGGELQGEEDQVSQVLAETAEVSTLVSPLWHVAHYRREERVNIRRSERLLLTDIEGINSVEEGENEKREITPVWLHYFSL